MRILHVIPTLSPESGGPAQACQDMAKTMAARGHDVEIYTINCAGGKIDPAYTERPLVVRDGFKIRYFCVRRPRFWYFSTELVQALKKNLPAFDIVHIHYLHVFPTLIAAYFCSLYGIPYIFRPCGSLDPYIYQRHRWRKSLIELAYQNRAFKGAAAIHCVTEEEEVLARPRFCGAAGMVVPLGVYPENYERLPYGALRARYPELNGRRIVLFFGRVNFKKGLDVLSQACGVVRRERDDVHLVIAGPDHDNMRPQIEGWLKQNGVFDRATFTGLLVGDEKLAALADSDLFVLPSYSENFGIAVVEAMACGLPVIVSDKVNLWREVSASGAGRVTSTDAGQVAHAILEILKDEAGMRHMADSGRSLVRERFSWHVIGGELETAYRDLIDKSHRRHFGSRSQQNERPSAVS